MSEGQVITPWEVSETASNANNPIHPVSGVMKYRVVLANAGARVAKNVEAATGDEAADTALRHYPGYKVAYVGPATASDTVTPFEDQ